MTREQIEQRKAILDQLASEGKLFTELASTKSAPNLEPIWGNWLFKGNVIEEVGEPGISKTTFNYAFTSALLNRQPFLGVNGVHPNIQRILYLDLESSDSLIKSRIAMLDIPDNPNFLKCNVPNVNLRELEPYISKLVQDKPISIIFVDPLRMAFPTKDENDNAEASQQMKYLRYLTEIWHCSIILAHHSSKAELSGTRKGSGAYARTSLADIVWNFENLGENYPPELFKFYIAKNRYIQDDFCVCVKKEEGNFQLVEFPIGYAVQTAGTRIYSLQQAIDVIMQDSKKRSPQEMLQILETMNMKPTRTTLYKALTALIQLGVIRKADYGEYIYI